MLAGFDKALEDEEAALTNAINSIDVLEEPQNCRSGRCRTCSHGVVAANTKEKCGVAVPVHALEGWRCPHTQSQAVSTVFQGAADGIICHAPRELCSTHCAADRQIAGLSLSLQQTA